MVTITTYIFINIFQMECFSAVKLAMGYEVVILESSKAWKKVEKIGLGTFTLECSTQTMYDTNP